MQNPNTTLRAFEAVRVPDLMTGLAKWGVGISLGLVGCLGILYIAAYSILLTRLPFHPFLIAAMFVLVTGVLLLWCIWTKHVHWRKLWITLLPVCFVLCMSVWGSGFIYDTSFDGQGYHQLAAFRIHNGWNPLYQPDFSDSLWVEHYPKGVWLLAAAIYTITDHLETGKAINLILMIAAFCSALGALLKICTLFETKVVALSQEFTRLLRTLFVIIIAACAACNPVTVVQLFTNYNDGLIASLLLTLISAGIYYTLTHERKALAIAALTIVLLINVKFTAIAYAGFICCWLIVAMVINHWRKHGRGFWKDIPILRALLVFLSSALIGLLIFGWNPYIVNTFKYGHPFYPLDGKDPIDIMTLNSPNNFIGENRLKTFLLSYTSKTEDVITPIRSTRATLWPIPWEDFQEVNVDTRVAGFGPLSPWILFGSAFLWVVICIFRWKAGVVTTLLILALLTTVFINPEPWWARYVPQLWLAPLILVTAGWLSNRRLIQAIALFLLIICGTDTLKSADSILHLQVEQSELVKTQIAELSGKQLTLYPKGFISPMIHLAERGITFTVAGNEQLCKNPTPFEFTPALYCQQTGE